MIFGEILLIIMFLMTTIATLTTKKTTIMMMPMMMMIFTGEHDVGDHPNAPEVSVQRQGLVVHHLRIVYSYTSTTGNNCDYFGKCDYCYTSQMSV